MNDGVLCGSDAIAKFCGVTKERVRAWMDENPDFPVRRDGMNGAWITTHRALLRWLNNYVTKPCPTRSQPFGSPPTKKRRSARRAQKARGETT